MRAACVGPVGTSTSPRRTPWGLGLQQKSLTASPLQFSVSQLGTAHSWLLPSCPGKEEQQRVATIPRAAWLVARSASPARGFMRVFTAAAWSLSPRPAIRCVWFGSRERTIKHLTCPCSNQSVGESCRCTSVRRLTVNRNSGSVIDC